MISNNWKRVIASRVFGTFVVVAFALLVVSIAGCKNEEPVPIYFQPENSTAVTDTEVLIDTLKLCNVGGTPYYVADPFIFVQSGNKSLVMTYVGTYNYDNMKGNWNLMPFLNKKDNVYWDSLSWIEAGSLASGEEIRCNATNKVPKVFYKFYMTYKPIYKRMLVKNETESGQGAPNATDAL